MPFLVRTVQCREKEMEANVIVCYDMKQFTTRTSLGLFPLPGDGIYEACVHAPWPHTHANDSL